MNYITINDEYKNRIEIKKSVFIASLFHVESADEANVCLEIIRKEHYKATHNCYAYVIGENSEIKKCSDDGEPSSTAGRPILNSIEQNNLTNILIVVTRYFGGIKLGASGLIRAYSAAASEVIKKAQKIKKTETVVTDIIYDYPFHGKLEVFLHKTGYNIENTQFTDKVKCIIDVPLEDEKKFKENFILLTNGQGEIIFKNTKFIDILCEV